MCILCVLMFISLPFFRSFTFSLAHSLFPARSLARSLGVHCRTRQQIPNIKSNIYIYIYIRIVKSHALNITATVQPIQILYRNIYADNMYTYKFSRIIRLQFNVSVTVFQNHWHLFRQHCITQLLICRIEMALSLSHFTHHLCLFILC